jgi:hypothetical protein
MTSVAESLSSWRASLLPNIPIGGLLSRNPTVYKWKAPFRCWLLREAALWRQTDLLTQSLSLHEQGHGLGARILLRSGFETFAALLYLNYNMKAVLDGQLDFHAFGELTTRLVVGAKNDPDRPVAVNVITMIDKGEKKYPGLRSLYGHLSESAHPNFEGMMWGYSKVDHDLYETNFSNRWMDLHGASHLGDLEICIKVFHHEYNDVWPELMASLEDWIVLNDARLEEGRASNAENEPPPVK